MERFESLFDPSWQELSARATHQPECVCVCVYVWVGWDQVLDMGHAKQTPPTPLLVHGHTLFLDFPEGAVF